ncbi:hypothetical protein [Xanthomonas floridensis]|uniref:DUF2628 domain-containing protein n=1 Tax=Xanthomonas floridensis TaxID=1843580 RepID=A0A1A9MGJ7_9XANT|nr:hypothetical protein [Xanthomonas floridensis]MEA5123656.1 hypothetical protein [Xanthomonas floridensis]MEA5131335.1 hypothetical protein [Xanthomonas floridensis]OAG69171.1 hypothetical protein A7D17_09850 [Xanthomonas floridensis]
MFMVEPVTPEPDQPHGQTPPPSAPWPADSPLDPAVAHFRGALCYQVWRRDQEWDAIAEGMHWSAALAPRGWALRYRHWPLLGMGAALAVLAAGVALAGAQAWSAGAWVALLLAELGLRVGAARQAGRWRSAALQHAGWQVVTRLRAISVADAVTTAQIRASRPQR